MLKILKYTNNKKCDLYKVNKIILWNKIEKLIKNNLKRTPDATGKLGYCPFKMFKVIFIQIWFGLSDRKIANFLYDTNSYLKVSGFILETSIPSYSSICRYRNKIIKIGLYQKIFELVNKDLELKKFINKKEIIVDLSIVLSSRNSRKKVNKNNETTYSDDIDASWTYKSNKYFYGCKIHMLCDANNGFIICGYVTTASKGDSLELIKLLNMTEITRGDSVLGDRSYPSISNRNFLESYGFIDKIMYKSYVNHPISDYKQRLNKKISKGRSRIESIFGTLKNRYNLRRAKFLGILKINAHFLIPSMIFNLKKIVLSQN